MDKCKYCEGGIYAFDNEELGHADIPIFDNYTEVTVDAFLTDGEVTNLAVGVGNLQPITVKINYCPMCGRKLNTA